MDYSLGIDLGTTYSAAATARGRSARDLPARRAGGDDPVGRRPARRRRGPRSARPPSGVRCPSRSRTAREFKRRLGDPTPIILGGTPYGAEALIGPPAAEHRRARSREQLGGPPAAIVVCHPASYGDVQDRPAPRRPSARPTSATVEFITEPRGRGAPLRPPGAGPGRRGHRRLRLRRRHVRRDDPAQDRGRLRAARPSGGHGAPRRDRLRRGGLRPRDGHRPRRPGSSSTRTTRRRWPRWPGCARSAAGPRRRCRPTPTRRSRSSLPGVQTEVRLTREEFESMIRPRIRETIAGARAGGAERRPRLRRRRPDPARRRHLADPARRRDGPRGDRAPGRARRPPEAHDGARGGLGRRGTPASRGGREAATSRPPRRAELPRAWSRRRGPTAGRPAGHGRSWSALPTAARPPPAPGSSPARRGHVTRAGGRRAERPVSGGRRRPIDPRRRRRRSRPIAAIVG